MIKGQEHEEKSWDWVSDDNSDGVVPTRPARALALLLCTAQGKY